MQYPSTSSYPKGACLMEWAEGGSLTHSEQGAGPTQTVAAAHASDPQVSFCTLVR